MSRLNGRTVMGSHGRSEVTCGQCELLELNIPLQAINNLVSICQPATPTRQRTTQ